MKKVMNTTAATNNTAIITVVADHYYEYPIDQLDSVVRNFGNTDATIYINRILMPDTDDETFFYASASAAKTGKVWCEELHSFVTPSFKSEFGSGCFDWQPGEYEELVLDAVYRDIYGYTPVTGDYGIAATRDEDVANLCSSHGYSVVPCKNPGIAVGVNPTGLWVIYPNDEDEDDDYTPDSLPESDNFVEYETGEIAFVGNHLRAYWNPWDSVAHFHLLDDAGHMTESSVGVELTQSIWRGICGDIEDNPGEYGISVETDYYGNGEYGMLIHHLETMPFDRYTDADGFIHRTGWEYLETNGDWVLEEESDTEHVLRVAMFGR